MGDAEREPRLLAETEIAEICAKALPRGDYAGRRVLIVIPDLTRTCPMGLLFRQIHSALSGVAARIDVLIALGTHPPLTAEQIYERVEITAAEHRDRYPDVQFHNHAWDDPEHLTEIGVITAERIDELSGGRFAQEVRVTCNRMVLDHDVALIVGPVFPHEVAGYSGGNKYLFPGISGPEVLHFFHWLGAVLTNNAIIGHKHTPVRAVIDAAAAMMPLERRALCMVVADGGLAGLYHGAPEPAWSAAADLSARLHVTYADRPFHTIVSCAPAMYRELWVGGKCVYKLEPVAADGGEIIVYAPHITTISRTHGALIEQIGYHTAPYFQARWDEFRAFPWGVLAHSTHVKGLGTFIDGVERPRIRVTLATGIPRELCERVNLGYRDPASIDVDAYAEREDQGVLLVRRAGETLYRLRP